MWKQLKDRLKKAASAMWCHRVVYGGLAASYGAGFTGMVGKDGVLLIGMGLYTMLALQKGH